MALSEGAIAGWDRRNIYYFQMLVSVAQHYGFDIDTPIKDLNPKLVEIILYGSGMEKIQFRYVNDRGDEYSRAHTFEGILPNMERRYRDTDSQVVRENLAKFLSTQKCPEVTAHDSTLTLDPSQLIMFRYLPSLTVRRRSL